METLIEKLLLSENLALAISIICNIALSNVCLRERRYNREDILKFMTELLPLLQFLKQRTESTDKDLMDIKLVLVGLKERFHARD